MYVREAWGVKRTKWILDWISQSHIRQFAYNEVRSTTILNVRYETLKCLQILAHELGHNLGMNHDFIDPYTSPKTIFRDASGNTCTDVNGVMDYYVTVQKWTTCSVERFTQHYNAIVSSQGTFCMPLNTGGLTPGFQLCLISPSHLSMHWLVQCKTATFPFSVLQVWCKSKFRNPKPILKRGRASIITKLLRNLAELLEKLVLLIFPNFRNRLISVTWNQFKIIA